MNDNTSQQSSTETPVVKRGPGRPRGSKNRKINTFDLNADPSHMRIKNDGLIARATKTYRALPPMKMSEAEFVVEFVKTVKNISIRPTDEQAGRLIYLDMVCHIPKAEAVKVCVDERLKEFYLEAMANLHRLDAHDRGGIS